MKKLMILLMICIFATTVMAEIFTDDFNRADNSTLGNDWIEDETYGIISIISNEAVINDTSSSQSINLQHCLVSDCSETNQVGNISFVWNVNNANQNNGFRISNIAGANSVLLLVSTGQLKYHDGSYHVLQSYTAGIDVQMTVFNMNYSTLTYSLDVGGTVYNNLGFQSANTGDQVIKFLTAGTFTGHIFVDDVSIDGTILITNLPPMVTVSSPANNTDTNIHESVQFTVTDDNNATTDCDLYVDTVLNQSNASVLNNTLTTFPMNWTDGLHTFYIECTDGDNETNTTGTYNLYFDEHEPNIVSGSPTITNSTIYTGYTANIFGNVTNLNLTNVTREILYPNSTQFYINETTAFVNSTFLGWNETFNTTLEPNGLWTYSIYAEDVLQNHSHYYSFTVDNCVPDWECSGYSACNASDLASCVSANDTQSCGLTFGTLGELLTDFPDQACDYCNDATTIVAGVCNSVTDLSNNTYTDANFATCCNVTGITTDCANDIVQNASVFYLVEVCSIFDYDEGDISLALIDTIGKGLLTYSFFIVIIVSLFIMSMQGVKELWRKHLK